MDLRRILKKIPVDFERVQEIRLQVEQPLLMVYEGREFYHTGSPPDKEPGESLECQQK